MEIPTTAIYALARCLVNLPLDGLAPPEPFAEILTALLSVEPAQRTELLIVEMEKRGLPSKAVMRAIGRLDPEAPPPAEAPPRRRSIFKADDLLDTEFPEPKWAIPGLVPEGLTLLGGRPKMGKSWWALEASEAVGSGGMFMGKKVERGKVIYFSLEDSPKRLKGRMKMIKWPRGLDVVFCYDLSPIGGTLAGLPAMIESANPTMVVVDTLSRAAQGVDQRSVSAVTDFLGPIQQTAVTIGCAVLIVDHHRKPPAGGRSEESDHADEFMESSGKIAVADCIISLFRKRGERGATLEITGRDLEDQKLAMEMDETTCCWQLLGEADDVRQNERARKILAALKSMGGWGNVKDIANTAQIAQNHASSTLQDLVEEGKVRKLPRMGKEQPYQLVEDSNLGL